MGLLDKKMVQIRSWTRPKMHFRSTWIWTKAFCVKKRFEHLVIKFWVKYTKPLHNCDLPHVQKPPTRTRTRRNFGHTWPLISDPTLNTVCNIHFYINNNFGALNELVSANFQMDSCLLMQPWSTAFFSELYEPLIMTTSLISTFGAES